MSFDEPSPELLPVSNETKSPKQNKNTWIFILIAAIVIICLCLVALALGFQAYRIVTSETNTQDTGTAEAQQAESTSGESIPTDEIESWTLLADEPYNENDLDWVEGNIDDEYVSMTLTIDNHYLWEGVTRKGFVWRAWPDLDDVSDFYLSVDTQNTGTNKDAYYGLVFRQTEDDQYYLFDIRDNGTYEIYKHQQNEWIELVSLTSTDTIKAGETNKLSVMAWDGWFSFYINGILVHRLVEGIPPEGKVGVAVGASNDGDTFRILFDNFTLRVP